MRELDRIAAELQRVVNGDAWHGPSLAELLVGVDETVAAVTPSGSPHSIHEIVLHILVWLEAVRRRLGGEAYQPKASQDWPGPERGPQPWADTLRRLDDETAHLLAAIRALDDAALDKQVPGKSYNADHMLHGIVHHTAYHAGQIALLKRLL